MARNKKVIRYRRQRNLNIGNIIFAVIFVYLVLSVATYLRRDKIQFYEVKEGSIVNDRSYTGCIFREELVRNAQASGHINYFVREGKRASAGSRIYSLDETGELSRFLEENQQNSSPISEENLKDLKRELTTFSLSYDDNSFSSVYDEKYTIQRAVSEYVNINEMDSMMQALNEQGIRYVQVTTDEPGVISYVIDDYEGWPPELIEDTWFDQSRYNKVVHPSGSTVEQGTPVYKLIPSEQWSVVFQMDEEDIETFAEEKVLRIKPASTDLTLRGRFSIFTGADGGTYGKLDFDKFMIQFVSQRFLNFEIQTSEAEGLKIPVSSVTQKEFYTIPVSYLGTGGDNEDGKKGVLKEVYHDGEISVEFTPVTIIYQNEEYFYTPVNDSESIKAGDYLVQKNSGERYAVGQVGSLEGCYDINKGYAVFSRIEKINENGEYYIISKKTKYGLNVYDHIVLDADTVEEGQMIY